MPVRQAAPTGSNKYHQRKLATSRSAFQDTSTMPATTSKVPAMISEVAGSRRTTMAMLALIATVGLAPRLAEMRRYLPAFGRTDDLTAQLEDQHVAVRQEFDRGRQVHP